jgi:hypothetical protein
MLKYIKVKFLKMNITRKNHFLPKFYLDGFTNDYGKLWMYDESKLYSPNCLKPENIGFEKKLYHQKIEEFLSKHIEFPAAPILKKLRNKEFP